jgi:6-pyruvoyltetrahydropterin/6-carboxytetrahydropterin synthase
MYNVKIRGHMMIAHSLPDKFFGPAQKLHGATYVTDVSFYSKTLDKHNVVIDIGLAHQMLSETLAPLQYQNLDDLPQFKGLLTTTEFLAEYIHNQLREKVKNFFNGKIMVTLGESHIDWASYEGEIR